MAKGIQFKIEGIKEVQQMLKKLPQAVNDKVSYDINRAAGKIVQQQLQADTPEGINDKASADKASSNVIITRSKTSKNGVWIGFAKRVWYIVNVIERGVKVRKTKKGANRGSITRKPFIEESHNKAFPAVVDFLTNNFLKLTNKSLRNQARRIRRKNLKRK